MKQIKVLLADGLAQLARLWQVLFFVYLPMLVLFAVLGLVSRASNTLTLPYFTRDVAAIGNLPFYAGLLSQLGGMFWAATVSICVLAAVLLGDHRDAGAVRRFLIQAAVLTTQLMLDDIYLVHEKIAPNYLNIGETAIVSVYFLLCLGFLLVNRRQIQSSEYSILGLALVLFAASVYIDVARLYEYREWGWFFTRRAQVFLEDAFKFAGIATWMVYFARYAIARLRSFMGAGASQRLSPE